MNIGAMVAKLGSMDNGGWYKIINKVDDSADRLARAVEEMPKPPRLCRNFDLFGQPITTAK